MRHRTRPIITVQEMGNLKYTHNEQGVRCEWEKAMVRLRGKWVCELFAPGTRLIVTRELRGDKLVLVLESLAE